jgi:hypothetical protein
MLRRGVKIPEGAELIGPHQAPITRDVSREKRH